MGSCKFHGVTVESCCQTFQENVCDYFLQQVTGKITKFILKDLLLDDTLTGVWEQEDTTSSSQI